ncbi:hypothetical protein Daura_19355 [Dactylosporangium aurantiacum]|uniref:Uncharacterized protein n=1 Tax=Dactylosporangium aurantiacum TaxID=35754 RepID=A0A9Q9IQS6_9ACTN|nr:hypothetical protein [Dactylosporangium aurantiacum]MDG6110363.1 hypothetical protein [Dactylosporangium aurantiacum]UWZ58132.1 hypothetical protein Daura_19355 [Dactylosporangium aurantiacum]
MTSQQQSFSLAGGLEWARRLGIAALAGGITGLLVGGVGGRLFMMALARLNHPRATGVLSDDGFIIGQFTLAGTLNLLLVGTVLGVIGGLVWGAIRGLRFGPLWWRRVSVPLGATLVIGAMMVHSDGVDFTLLDPPLLAVGLTLMIPLLASTLITWLGDRWIGSDQTVWQRVPAAVAWTARGALALFAGWALVDLVTTISRIL